MPDMPLVVLVDVVVDVLGAVGVEEADGGVLVVPLMLPVDPLVLPMVPDGLGVELDDALGVVDVLGVVDEPVALPRVPAPELLAPELLLEVAPPWSPLPAAPVLPVDCA